MNIFSIFLLKGHQADVSTRTDTPETESSSLSQKIQAAAQSSLRNMTLLFSAFVESSCRYETAYYAIISFKRDVLGYREWLGYYYAPEDIYLAAFKIAMWMLELTGRVTTQTASLFLEKTRDVYSWNDAFFKYFEDLSLSYFAEEGIDIRHIKTKRMALDTNGIPKSVKIDDLAEIFDTINFSDRNKLGYMAPATRDNGTGILIVKTLKESLNKFIGRVNTEELFSPVPPSCDNLADFYRCITDALRLSIHAVEQAVVKAEAEYRRAEEEWLRFRTYVHQLKSEQDHVKRILADKTLFPAQLAIAASRRLSFIVSLSAQGDALKSNYERRRNNYDAALTAKARIALDIAFAGMLCITEYMAEAMTVYYVACEGKEVKRGDSTLEEMLVELLADKRKTLALGQVQTHFPSVPGAQEYQGLNPHGQNLYMSQLGEILGLPNTKGIREYFSAEFDRNRLLRDFFAYYTEDAIIETVREAIKTNRPLREKVIDWAQTQIPEERPASQLLEQEETIAAIQAILQEKQVPLSGKCPEQQLHELILHLKTSKVSFPSFENGWGEFLFDLWKLDEAKKWLATEFQGLSGLNHANAVNRLQMACSTTGLESAWIDRFTHAILHDKPITIDELTETAQQRAKRPLIQEKLPVEGTVITRVLKGDTSLEEVVQGVLERKRCVEYLDHLGLGQTTDTDVAPDFIEQLLVSHRILMPQTSDVQLDRLAIEPHSNYVAAVLQVFNNIPTIRPVDRNWVLYWYGEWSHSLNTQSSALLEGVAQTFVGYHPELDTGRTSTKRDRAGQWTSADRLLKMIFDQSFRYDPDTIISAAEQLTAPQQSSSMRRVFQIHLPGKIASFFGNFIVRTAARIYTFIYAYRAIISAYETTSAFTNSMIPYGYGAYQTMRAAWAGRVIPFCMQHTAPAIILGVDTFLRVLLEVRKAVLENKWHMLTCYKTSRIMFTVCICTLWGIARLNNAYMNDMMDRTARRIQAWIPPFFTRLPLVRAMAQMATFLLGSDFSTTEGSRIFLAYEASVWADAACNRISDTFHRIAQYEQKKRLVACKGYEKWQKATRKNNLLLHPS